MKTHLRFARLACAVATAFTSSIVLGQVPDAGSLQRQIDRERENRLPPALAPRPPSEPPALKALAGPAVTVTAFRFAGNVLLSTEQLTSVVAGYLNRPLDFNQLQGAATAVANAYREAGWSVRTYLPKQEVVDGIVTIQIVEAVFGGARREGNEPLRLKLDTVLSVIDNALPKGKPLNVDALDRALLLAEDIPGVAVSGTLTRGARDGETELVLKMSDKPLWVGDVGVDNTGSRGTGKERITANASLNSPEGAGEVLTMSAIHTEGSDYIRLGGTVPVGLNGWRAGVNASLMNYKLVAPEFKDLDSTGSSVTSGFEASYPIVRKRMTNLYLALAYDRKNFDNRAAGRTTSHYQIDEFTVGLNANLFDNFSGGGTTSAGLTYIDGTVDLEGSPNQFGDSTTTDTAGHFGKLRWTLSRQQVITEQLAAFAMISGQMASKNLDSGEKFYLGGAGGVRAYPSSEAGGSQGHMLNLELRYRLSEGLTLSSFYDYGEVTVNKNNDFRGAPALNHISLKGAGLAMAWLLPVGINIKTVWAHRIGDNPNPTISGNDQDGSLIRNRFWLTASAPF